MDDVAEHAHCRICRKVCPPGEDTCSPACQRERTRRLQARRNYLYLLYATGAIIVVLFVTSALHP